MDDHEWLAERIEQDRTHLRAVAYRMLGSPIEADDAVQEAWLRLSRSDTSDVENLSGWLTTVVARGGASDHLRQGPRPPSGTWRSVAQDGPDAAGRSPHTG